jgi:hypothetical protein
MSAPAELAPPATDVPRRGGRKNPGTTTISRIAVSSSHFGK